MGGAFVWALAKSLRDTGLDGDVGEVEVEGWEYVVLKTLYSGLFKGKGHKYLRRVPYTDAKGKRRYRYYYKLTGGKGHGHKIDFVQGASFYLPSDGEDGHIHIKTVHADGTVTIEHDESHKRERISKEEFQRRLRAATKSSFKRGDRQHEGREELRARLRQQLEDVYEHGTKRQIARLEVIAQKYGVEPRKMRSIAKIPSWVGIEGACKVKGGWATPDGSAKVVKDGKHWKITISAQELGAKVSATSTVLGRASAGQALRDWMHLKEKAVSPKLSKSERAALSQAASRLSGDLGALWQWGGDDFIQKRDYRKRAEAVIRQASGEKGFELYTKLRDTHQKQRTTETHALHALQGRESSPWGRVVFSRASALVDSLRGVSLPAEVVQAIDREDDTYLKPSKVFRAGGEGLASKHVEEVRAQISFFDALKRGNKAELDAKTWHEKEGKATPDLSDDYLQGLWNLGFRVTAEDPNPSTKADLEAILGSAMLAIEPTPSGGTRNHVKERVTRLRSQGARVEPHGFFALARAKDREKFPHAAPSNTDARTKAQGKDAKDETVQNTGDESAQQSKDNLVSFNAFKERATLARIDKLFNSRIYAHKSAKTFRPSGFDAELARVAPRSDRAKQLDILDQYLTRITQKGAGALLRSKRARNTQDKQRAIEDAKQSLEYLDRIQSAPLKDYLASEKNHGFPATFAQELWLRGYKVEKGDPGANVATIRAIPRISGVPGHAVAKTLQSLGLKLVPHGRFPLADGEPLAPTLTSKRRAKSVFHKALQGAVCGGGI